MTKKEQRIVLILVPDSCPGLLPNTTDAKMLKADNVIFFQNLSAIRVSKSENLVLYVSTLQVIISVVSGI